MAIRLVIAPPVQTALMRQHTWRDGERGASDGAVSAAVGRHWQAEDTAQQAPRSREATRERLKEAAGRGNAEPGAGRHCRGKMRRVVRKQPVRLALHGRE